MGAKLTIEDANDELYICWLYRYILKYDGQAIYLEELDKYNIK